MIVIMIIIGLIKETQLLVTEEFTLWPTNNIRQKGIDRNEHDRYESQLVNGLPDWIIRAVTLPQQPQWYSRAWLLRLFWA